MEVHCEGEDGHNEICSLSCFASCQLIASSFIRQSQSLSQKYNDYRKRQNPVALVNHVAQMNSKKKLPNIISINGHNNSHFPTKTPCAFT